MGDDMHDTAAARLAVQLSAAKKAQSLGGADIAERVGRLTGERPTELWVSRRLSGRKALLYISDDLFLLAAALELDPMDLIEDAVRNPAPPREVGRRAAVGEASQ